jgi:hypothetical protein
MSWETFRLRIALMSPALTVVSSSVYRSGAPAGVSMIQARLIGVQNLHRSLKLWRLRPPFFDPSTCFLHPGKPE